jgi:hypothetical protein
VGPYMLDQQIGIEQILHRIGKGKAVPLQAWTGPQGSGRLRLPDL